LDPKFLKGDSRPDEIMLGTLAPRRARKAASRAIVSDIFRMEPLWFFDAGSAGALCTTSNHIAAAVHNNK
jgi:hypothetical protein